MFGAGVIEDVDGAVDDLVIALGIAVGKEVEEDILLVVHVNVLVDDDDELGEAHLPRAPDRVHHPPRLHRVFLVDFDEGAVVKHAADRQRVIDDVRNEHLQKRKENPLGRLAQEIILHRRLADDRGRVDRILAHGDRGDVEGGVEIGEGIEAGVIAERALQKRLGWIDVSFYDDFSIRGDLQVDRPALDQLDSRAVEKAGE